MVIASIAKRNGHWYLIPEIPTFIGQDGFRESVLIFKTTKLKSNKLINKNSNEKFPKKCNKISSNQSSEFLNFHVRKQ